MPIAAIPQGVEIRKISAVQKRALDELLGKQKETSLIETLIPSLTLLTLGLTGAYIYIKRDTIKDSLEDLERRAKEYAGQTVTEAFTTFGETVTGGAFDPTQPSSIQPGGVDLTVCQQYENDLIELRRKEDDVGEFDYLTKFAIGYNKQAKYQGMKANGCSKPPYVPQNDWDKA
jgi:hypothetical protein